MLMKFNVLDRQLINGLLPMESNVTNLKLIRLFREELSFDEKENKKLKFKDKGEFRTWDPKANFEKEIELGHVIFDIIRSKLIEMNESKPPTLTDSLVSLYDRFVTDEDEKA